MQLTGTPKQIAWATDIRRLFVEQDVNDLVASAESVGQTERATLYRSRAAALIAAHPDAQWWINNRNNLNAKRILRTLNERLGKVQMGQDNWTPDDVDTAR